MVTVIRGLAEREWCACGRALTTLDRIFTGLHIERVHETVQRAVRSRSKRSVFEERFS